MQLKFSGICGTLSTMVVAPPSTLKQRLADAMDRAGKDVAALARDMGLSYQAVRKWTDGKTVELTASNNSKLAKLLNVDPDWLATGEGSMDCSQATGEAARLLRELEKYPEKRGEVIGFAKARLQDALSGEFHHQKASNGH